MKSYRNIIFDLGGVLLNISPTNFAEKLSELSTYDISKDLKRLATSGFLDNYEAGQFSDEIFINHCIEELKLSIAPTQLIEAWNSILLDFPSHRLELLKNLALHKRIFLLSNTNQIHINRINQYMFDTHSLSGLDTLFEEVFLSHKMGLRKPDVEIYRAVLKKHSLFAEETVFIDDSLKNVEAAIQVGIFGVHLKPGVEIGQLLRDLKLI